MQNNNIIIESNLSQNEELPKIEDNKEINLENKDNNSILLIESKDIQTENLENNNSENIIETEQNKINNNNNDSQDNSSPLEIKDNHTENIEKLNEEINSNQLKEEKNQNTENKEDTEKKSKNKLSKKDIQIIDEAEEYKTIDSILQERQNNTINNNQIYFTEANTLIPRNQGDFRDIHKSNSNKLYVLTSIPEYTNIKQKKICQTPGRLKPINQKNKTKNVNLFLNNLSPEVYMKKKIIANKENEVNILKTRIKKIEEEIQKQNEYDFKKAMKECKMQYIKNMKNKEKERQIEEEHKKMEEKLKNMEEYRKNLINNRIKKILQRQKSKNNRNKKSFDNSSDNTLNEPTIKDKLDKINNDKILKTLELYDEKLPILPGMPKHEIIKMIKDKEENIFCINTEQRLKDLEKNHRKNYLKHLNSINNKLAKQNEIYNLRSEKCITVSKEKAEELEENFKAKEMLKRFNIKQNILRELSERDEKIKGSLTKNIENVKEKKELLKKQEQQKIKKILKRLNRKNSIDLKKNNANNEYSNNQRIYFSNLQKENLNKANNEIKDYYNELILRREDYFWIIRDLQRDESSSKIKIQKKAKEAQNKKINEIKSLNKFMEKMDRDNINNQKNGTKMKMYLEQRKIEFENKKREEEEAALLNKQ